MTVATEIPKQKYKLQGYSEMSQDTVGIHLSIQSLRPAVLVSLFIVLVYIRFIWWANLNKISVTGHS